MRRIYFLVLLGVLFLIVGTTYAEEEKTYVTVGIKTWYNQWGGSYFTTFSEPATGPYKKRFKFSSNSVLSVGPTLSVRKGKFFGGISCLKTTSDYKQNYTYALSTTVNRTLNQSISRYDIDGSLGYYFHPRLGGFIGYKYSNHEVSGYREDVATSGAVQWSGTFKDTIKASGPVFGLTGNYPIGSTGIAPFLTASYYFLRLSSAEKNDRISETGPSLEAGVAYSFKRLTAIAAYKQQYLYGTDVEEEFKGPMFSLNYTF